MLHVCVFEGDEDALLVDVPDVEAAKAAARAEVGEPKKVVPIAMGIGWRVGWFESEDDPDLDLLEFEALPHVPELWAALEEAIEREEVPLPIASAPACTSEADGPNGQVLRCELGVHASSEQHRSGEFSW